MVHGPVTQYFQIHESITYVFLTSMRVAPWLSIYMIETCLVGGFNPSEKYESQLGLLFPIYGKIKNVPNHQPDVDV